MEGSRDQVSSEIANLGTRDNPVYFKWFRDRDDKPDWSKILLAVGLTVLSGYLAAKSQRWGSSAVDPVTTLKLKVAQKKITLGNDLQRLGRIVEESGWTNIERIRQ